MANELASLPLGFGLANMAKNTVNLQKQYNQYVIRTQEQGETPMTFEEWSKSQGS